MRFLSTFLALVVCAGSVSAQLLPQRFTGTTPRPVPAEGTINVKYRNPGRANSTITVEAYNGADPTQTRDVTITINGSGQGSGTFDVPQGWSSVVLSYPDSADMTVVVQDSMPRPVKTEPPLAARR